MSTDSNTKPAVDISEEATKRIEIYVTPERANEILASFEVPMPNAADIDEIRLIVRE